MSKKNSTFAPKMSKITFLTPYTYKPIFEESDSTPTAEVVPNEALSIREMLIRTDRGQRLNVHTRMRSENMPDNMYPESEVDRLNESLQDAPPDGMDDRVDVENYQQELAERKRELEDLRKAKRSERKDDGHPGGESKEKPEGPGEKSEAASEAKQ